MPRFSRKHLRPLAFVSAFLCSLVLTGCGGGGGGSSTGNPFIAGPTASNAVVEGYVSQAAISPAIRANIGAALQQPLVRATVRLIVLTSLTGAETVLGTAQTDDKGYYQISFTTDRPEAKNFLLKAEGTGVAMECVLPKIRSGMAVRAPTIDPSTGVQAKIVREAARYGKQEEINLGELLALLPADLLAQLQTRLAELVKDLIAREEAIKNLLGSKNSLLRQYAFDMQQRILEAVEKGEITAAEAWSLFREEMTRKAKELGLTAADQKAIDDVDQAMVIETTRPGLADNPATKESWEKMETERLRERKLNLLTLVEDSLKVLVGAKAGVEFKGFFELTATLRGKIEASRTPAEIYRLFQDASDLMVQFGKYLTLALVEVRFTPDLVTKVFAIATPEYGFTTADGSSSSGGNAGLKGVEQADPAGKAIGFVRLQNDYLARLVERVLAVATDAGLSLSPEQAKAIAYLIWSGSSENLNYPDPISPVDPIAPEERPTIQLSGRVIAAAEPAKVDGLAYAFTHRLQTTAYAVVEIGGEGVSKPVNITPTDIAWLAADSAITIVKTDAAGNATKVQGTLDQLTGYEFVEIEGKLVRSPYRPMPMPTPVDPTNPAPEPMPMPPDGEPGTIEGSSGGGSGGSSTSNTGTAVSGTTTTVSPTLEPMYLVVTVARVLPPPPPAPRKIADQRGRIVQPQTSGRPVDGLFLFESGDPELNGALLQPVRAGLNDASRISLSAWVGKEALVTGILYPGGPDQPKTILVVGLIPL